MSERIERRPDDAPEAPELSSIEDALAWLKAKIAELLASGTPRPVMVKVLGFPNTGKSHFIKAYLERHGNIDKNGRVLACLWDESEMSWNRYAAEADLAFVHDAGVNAVPDVLGVRGKNRPYDLILYLYNPAMYRPPDNDFRRRVQLIVCNEGSTRK